MKDKRILVVDDLSPMRAFIKAGIRGYISTDIAIDEASSGPEAQELLKNVKYDLILCDWNMPGMNGSELLRWLREQEGIKETPFVMITASSDESVFQGAVKAGVDDYIIKPVTGKTLSDKVGRFLK